MSDTTDKAVSVPAFLGTFGAGLTTIASVISDVLSPLAPVSLYLGLAALLVLVACLFCSRSRSLNDWFTARLPGIWPRPFAAALGIAVVGLFTTYFLSAGHKEAGGFSITEENIPEFQSAFEEAVDELGIPAGKNCSLYADSEITLEDCGLDLITFIDRLAPFGPGNHEPVFLLKSIKALSGSRIVGDAHLKMAARDSAGTVHDIIGFSLGRAWSPGAIDGKDLDMLVHLRRNSYMGKVRSQLQVTAIRLAGEPD